MEIANKPDEKGNINFSCSIEDKRLIGQILAKGIAMAKEYNVEIDHVLVSMDITACHCNGCPLKLYQFLLSSPMDFAHDFCRIGLNIDRKTGKLMNGWRPLFAVENPGKPL
jgi:hypothetical protein